MSRFSSVWSLHLPAILSGCAFWAATSVISVVLAQAVPPAYPAPATWRGSEVIGSVDDYEVLPHGVIHEAFVDPAGETTEPRLAPQQPPAAIQEQPPAEKPQGNHVVWVPGYWAWDWIEQPQDESAGRRGFVWVSGMWRDVPPGRSWVPGHWTEAAAGQYQWNAGYWLAASAQPSSQFSAQASAQPSAQASAAASAPAAVTETVVYLPVPPGTVDRGPSSPSPGDDCFWIPGCWRHRGGSYVWTPGYWARQHPGWVWTPARYVHTPRGCVFVGGYWDYEPARRGSLFGVVVFRRPVCYRPTYVYCPARRVQFHRLMDEMYVDSSGCFCYGHHHHDHAFHRSFCPWYESCDRWRRTTPLVSYFRWQSARKGLSVSIGIGGSSGRVARGQSRGGHFHDRHHDVHDRHHDIHDYHHDHRFEALGAGNRRPLSHSVSRSVSRSVSHDRHAGHQHERSTAQAGQRSRGIAVSSPRTVTSMPRRGVRAKATNREHTDHDDGPKVTVSAPRPTKPSASKVAAAKVAAARQAAAASRSDAAKRAEARRSMLRSSSRAASPAKKPAAQPRPKTTPQAAPKATPKAAPKATPKATQKPSPRQRSKPAPKPAAQPHPKPSSKSADKKEDAPRKVGRTSPRTGVQALRSRRK